MAALKAGGMGSPGEIGVPSAFQSSMASAIETALNLLLPGEGREQLLINDNSAETRDRRILFCAIAQGVVSHLQSNSDAFQVHLHYDSNGVLSHATITINTQ